MEEIAEEHGADLERREAEVTVREVALAARMRAAHAILAAADDRDATADLRDAAAVQRENDLDLARMLDTSATYGDYWHERRCAALDRMHSEDDRMASRGDRIHLAEGYGEDMSDQA